jgi:hypothetical protein
MTDIYPTYAQEERRSRLHTFQATCMHARCTTTTERILNYNTYLVIVNTVNPLMGRQLHHVLDLFGSLTFLPRRSKKFLDILLALHDSRSESGESSIYLWACTSRLESG